MRKSRKSIIVALILLGSIIAYGIFVLTKSRSYQLFGTIVSHVSTEDKVVALTFDDGPAQNTREIMDILKQYDVHATFFLTGKEMKEHPELAIAIVNAGHSIGNHSYSHKRMVFMDMETIANEIEETDKIIKTLGFEKEIYFRPPYCRKFIYLPWYLDKKHRITVTWDIEPDSKNEAGPEEILNDVQEKVKPGSIILLHAMYKDRTPTLEALPGIIVWLKKNGYSLLTINELLQKK